MVISRDLSFFPEGDKVSACVARGDCMEGREIEDGDILLIDEDRFPGRKSVCICSCPYANDGGPMVKEYDCQIAPGVYSTRTRYKDRLMQAGFFCNKIIGVVFACIAPDGAIKWNVDATALGREPDAVKPNQGNCSFAGFMSIGTQKARTPEPVQIVQGCMVSCWTL